MVDTNGEQVDAEDLDDTELEDVITDILPFLKKDLMRAEHMALQHKGCATTGEEYRTSLVLLQSDIHMFQQFVSEYEEFVDSDDEDEKEDNEMFRETIVGKVEYYARIYKVKVNRAAN